MSPRSVLLCGLPAVLWITANGPSQSTSSERDIGYEDQHKEPVESPAIIKKVCRGVFVLLWAEKKFKMAA